MTKKEFSTKVEFDGRHYEFAHGKKARFSQDACGWAFTVPAWDGGKEIIWTKGRTAREMKAEIAAKVRAPVGTTIVAFILS